MTWTHRERILAALNHEEPDRVPIDFGGAEFTSITLAGYEKLKKHMGVDEPTEVMSIIHTCAHPAETILDRFGVDRWEDDNTYYDTFNVLWKRTEKAVDQHFLHQDGPFHGGKLTVEQVEEYDWPDGKNPGLVKGVRERVEHTKANGDHAVCLYIPGGVIHRGYLCSSSRSVAGGGIRDKAAISARISSFMSMPAAARDGPSCSRFRAPTIGQVISGCATVFQFKEINRRKILACFKHDEIPFYLKFQIIFSPDTLGAGTALLRVRGLLGWHFSRKNHGQRVVFALVPFSHAFRNLPAIV